MELAIPGLFLLLFIPFEIYADKNKNNGINANAANNTNNVKSSSNMKPAFSWIDLHCLRVYFDETDEETVVLYPTKSFGNTIVPCLYEGSLESKKSGTVTVSGCRNDEVIHVVIYSERLPTRHMFDLRNGEAEEVEWVYGGKKNDGRKKRETFEDYVEEYYDDDGVNDGLPEVPPVLVLNVKLGYEETLLAQIGSHLHARQYITRVFTFGKHHFQHFSLGTKIWLNLTQPIQFVANQTWTPRRSSLKKIRVHKEKEAVPITFFCFADDTNNFMGASYTRRACDVLKGVAVAKWRSNIHLAAQTYVHENGHLLGTQHDEIEDRRNPEDKPCTGTGVMSVSIDPDRRPSTWSDCSRRRFQKWFYNLEYNTGDCLKTQTQDYLQKLLMENVLQNNTEKLSRVIKESLNININQLKACRGQINKQTNKQSRGCLDLLPCKISGY